MSDKKEPLHDQLAVEKPFTDEEEHENSRVDAVAILALVVIVVGLASYYVSL